MNDVSMTLILEGLSCAHCADKIDEKIKKIPTVKKSTMNFMGGRINILLSNEEDKEEVYSQVKSIVKEIEPLVMVKKLGENTAKIKDNKAITTRLTKIIIGAVLFAISLIIKVPATFQTIPFGLAYLVLGAGVLVKAAKNILKGQVFDENFLMAIASLGAFVIGEHPEAVAVMLFYQVGELFQEYAVDRSKRSIASLLDIKSEFANVIIDDKVQKVDPDKVAIGSIIVIRPGEKVPLDGIVIEGESSLDTSMLTGESVPRDIRISDEILAGFINKSGLLKVRVTKNYNDTSVAKILNLIQNASANKSKAENFITKFARYYTPVVVALAAVLAVVPPLVTGGAFSAWIYRALVFLVVSCPCALVISIPMGFFGGIGGASRCGIMVKGGNYLDALSRVKAVVFDITGTLTKGKFELVKVTPVGITKEELLRFAAHAEAYSTHPIAISILERYDGEIDESQIESYKEIAGRGISATINGRKVLIGKALLLKDNNIETSADFADGTVVHVAIDSEYKGAFLIKDDVKPDSKRAVQELKNIGVEEVVMFTGDIESVGKAVAKELGIDKIHAEMLPEDKVTRLEEIIKTGASDKNVVFVGDGINDAAVLTRADIGIAMGALGSDAAIEAADVVIMTDEPSKIVTSIKISRRTKSIVIQNIVFALGIKGIVLLLSALGYAGMWQAVFADVGVSFIAILNSMRALNVSAFKK